MGLLQHERVRKYVLVCGGAEADAHEHLQKSGWDLEHAIDEHRKEERRRQEEQKEMIERFREQRSSDEEVHMTASFLAGLRSHTDALCCRPRDDASRRQTGTRGAHWHCWRRSEWTSGCPCAAVRSLAEMRNNVCRRVGGMCNAPLKAIARRSSDG